MDFKIVTKESHVNNQIKKPNFLVEILLIKI